MEFELNHKIKKNDTEKIALPNLKMHGLTLSKIRFGVTELEFTLFNGANSLFKYGEPYFKVFNEIDLSNYASIISEGLDMSMSVRNTSKKELELGIFLTYTKNSGNIIYSMSFNFENILENCLKDIQDAGQITQLIIHGDQPITSVILDPIFKLRDMGADIELGEDLSIWTNVLAMQNEKPLKRVTIDFTDKDLSGYVKYLKYFRLKISTVDQGKAKDDKKEANESKVHLIAYGFKN